MKNILITGYEPFGGDAYNPSIDLARKLEGETYKGYQLKAVEVPVRHKTCVPTVVEAIERYQPEIIIATGLAWGRASITVERVAINVMDFPIADNDGHMVLNTPIEPQGPAAYFSTLPIRAIVKQIREAGIPAKVSNTAGTFCCNLQFYGILHYLATHNLSAKAGIIHIPFAPEQIAEKGEDVPTMSLENMMKAIWTAAQAAADYDEDVDLVCGAVN